MGFLSGILLARRLSKSLVTASARVAPTPPPVGDGDSHDLGNVRLLRYKLDGTRTIQGLLFVLWITGLDDIDSHYPSRVALRRTPLLRDYAAALQITPMSAVVALDEMILDGFLSKGPSIEGESTVVKGSYYPLALALARQIEAGKGQGTLF